MTPLTDELLARRLADRAAGAPAISLAAIARSVSAQPRRRSPAVGIRVAGPIAAVLVVAIAVGGGLLSRGSAPPASPGVASATSPTGNSASGAPSAPAAWTALTWEEASAEAFESDQTVVADAIAVGDGFVAVGTMKRDGVRSGHVWLSAEGRTWERAADPGFGTLWPLRIVDVGQTLVLLGWHVDATDNVIGTAELWSSVDGRAWTRGPDLPPRGGLSSAAGGPAGILVNAGLETWLIGPDLSAFVQTSTWPDDVRFGSIAWAGGRWVMPGTTGAAPNGDPSRAVVWTSPDGTRWTQQAVNESAGGMFTVLAAANGLVGIGSSRDLCFVCRGPLGPPEPPAVWASTDGASWRAVALGVEVPRFPSFTGDGRRILAIGRERAGPDSSADGWPMLSQTLDGLTWAPVALLGDAPTRLADLGSLVVGPHGVASLPIGVIDESSGSFIPHVWWAAAVGATEPGPSPSADPAPLVTGCDELGFDARRCAAIVARATERAGNPAGVVGVVVLQPDQNRGVTLGGGGPIATVDFTLVGGAHQRVDVLCGNTFGVSADRVCSDDPQIAIYGGVSTDVPCGATPGDDNHPCATLPPKPRPASVRRSTPLILPTFDVSLDHVGHYEVLVGTASLPDGMLRERSGTLADPRPTTFWIDGGIQIAVRPGNPCIGARCQQIETIYTDPFDGPRPVNVYLVFDVVELAPGGAVLEIRNLVVR